MKSIQMKILLLSGLAMVIIVSAFFGYSLFTSLSKQEYITETVKNISEKDGEEILIKSAERESLDIKAEIEVAHDAARTLAQTLSTIKVNNSDLDITREEVNEILKNILKQNPTFLGVYTAWEKNAFDNKDEFYKNTKGHDETGRYIPYFNRDGNGNIALEPLVDYENTQRDANGVRAGEYYLLPRETKEEVIIDPYEYEIQGKSVLLTSLVVPIVVDNEFYGIAGIDISLDFISSFIDKANKELYNGTGYIAVFSNNGTIAAYSGDKSLIGKGIDALHHDWEEDLKVIQSGEMEYEPLEEELNTFIPINIGKTTTPWSVQISVPNDEVFKSVNQLMDTLKERFSGELTTMIIIGIILLVLALVALWFISRSISKPIKLITNKIKDISEGDGDLTARLQVKSKDEIGELSTYFNKFLENLHNMIVRIRYAVNQINEGIGQISQSTQSLSEGASKQASSMEEITASINEMSSQIQANTENIQKTNEIVQTTGNKSLEGTKSMDKLVESMNKINESADDINNIIKVIDEIAFQTNLLALNADIEAARVGKYGKGFAVVANSVRTLAGRSSEAVKDTSEKIDYVLKNINEVNELVKTSADFLSEINSNAEQASVLMSEISDASQDQANSIEQISTGLGQIEEVVQNNSADAEENAASTEELASMSNSVHELVSYFKVDMQKVNDFQSEKATNEITTYNKNN